MRIGIVPSLNPSGGGVYQYSMTMLRTLHEWTDRTSEDEFVVFSLEPNAVGESLNGRHWTFERLVPEQSRSLEQKILETLRGSSARGHIGKRGDGYASIAVRSAANQEGFTRSGCGTVSPGHKQWFQSCGVELMLYPAHSSLPFEAGIPYVMAIHDLQHRLQPEFPEVSANGEWESREYYLRNGARNATLVLADSEVGKEDILNFYGPYGVTPDQVKVLPFLPASCLAVDISEREQQQVQMRYRLPDRYLFYPAQFWPHKNHGSDRSGSGFVRARAQPEDYGCVLWLSCRRDSRARVSSRLCPSPLNLGVENQIHYLGYVPDEDMSGIYARAAALVMPTFFGPTNIPILEAWAFGCPV